MQMTPGGPNESRIRERLGGLGGIGFCVIGHLPSGAAAACIATAATRRRREVLFIVRAEVDAAVELKRDGRPQRVRHVVRQRRAGEP